MKFYNLKTRSHVEVPDSEITKTKLEKKTSNGVQVRYAMKAVVKGDKLFKFVSEKDFKESKAKEE
jgi:hypothetical protein